MAEDLELGTLVELYAAWEDVQQVLTLSPSTNRIFKHSQESLVKRIVAMSEEDRMRFARAIILTDALLTTVKRSSVAVGVTQTRKR